MAGPFARLRRGEDAGADSPADMSIEPGPADDGDTNPTAEMPQAPPPALPPVDPDNPVSAPGTIAPAGEPTVAPDAEPTADTDPGRPADAPAPLDPPADTDTDTDPVPEQAPSFLARGRARRRLRFVRRAREVALRDLGGLVFDLHRFGRDRSDLVDQKLTALRALDAEMRALARALDDPGDETVLREPGLAGCPRCGALHASDARFCSSCGLPVGKGMSLPAGPTFAGPAPPSAAAPDPPEAPPGGDLPAHEP